MKSMLKAIIAGICVIVLGVVVLLVGLGLNGWTFSPSFTTEEFIAQEENTAIKLTNSIGSVKISYGDTDKVTVVYPVSKQYKYTVAEKDGTVSVEGPKAQWFNFGLWWTNIPDTKITLPKNYEFNLNLTVNAGRLIIDDGTYGNLKLEVNAGSLKLNNITCNLCEANVSAGSLNAADIICNKFDGTVSAGGLKADKMTCDDIKVNVSAGSLSLKVDGAKADYTISATVSAGSSNVSSQTGADENKKIRANVSAGYLKINFTA